MTNKKNFISYYFIYYKMAKRGRRSIRNKRKSVKKYSSKRRSKTMRYLRGGTIRPHTSYQGVSEFDEHIIRNESIKAAQKKADDALRELQLAHKERMAEMTPEQQEAFYDSDDGDGGGRRRYHRRKQSKSRSRKH